MKDERSVDSEASSGAVVHSSGLAVGDLSRTRSVWKSILQLTGERVNCFCLLVAGDTILFLLLVVGMIIFHRPRQYLCVKINGHSFFKRERMASRQHRAKHLFLLYLALSQNHVQGADLSDNDHPSGSDSALFPGDSDFHSLMARSDPTWTPPQLPSPNLPLMGRPAAESDEGGSSRSREEVDAYYQMAFIFTLDPSTTTRRLNWEDYWTMHGQISETIGIHLNQLVAVFNVHHLPRDLEELETHAIIAVRAEDVRHGGNIAYVLVDIEAHEEQNARGVSTKRLALDIPWQRTRTQILESLKVSTFCHRVDDRCLVWINNARWKLGDPTLRSIKSGDYLRVALPPQPRDGCGLDDDLGGSLAQGLFGNEGQDRLEGDHNFLMQIGPTQEHEPGRTHTSVQIQLAHVYGLGRDYMEIPITAETGSYIEAIVQMWDIPQEDVVDIHEVLEPPMDLQQSGEVVMLLESRGDDRSKLFASDKLILGQLEISSIHAREIRRIRNVLWSRKLLQRQQALALLRVDSFCQRKQTRECVVTHNNRLWDSRDRSSHCIQDGDFIQVEAFVDDRSLQEARQELSRLEEHECQRRLYTQAEQEICGEDTPVTVRSRSRSREGESAGGALGSEEDSTWDPSNSRNSHDRDNTGGHSLLQINMMRLNSTSTPHQETFSRLPPPGNPSLRNVEPAPSSRQLGWSPAEDDESAQELEDFTISISDQEVEIAEENRGSYNRRVDHHEGDWDFVKLFQAWSQDPLELVLPQQLELPPIALQFVADSAAGWHPGTKELHIYTDGSYDSTNETASFAVAVFGWRPDQENDRSVFIGWTAQVVCTDPQDANYVGAETHSVATREISGLTWAHLWLLQSGCAESTVFHYDSLMAGHGAAGLWQVKEDNHQLRKLRCIAQLLKQLRPGAVAYEHVKSHSGNPGNELVDSLAKHRIQFPGVGRKRMPSWQPLFLSANRALEWAWWHVGLLKGNTSLPTGDCNGASWTSQYPDSQLPTISAIEKRPCSDKVSFHLSLKIASYNVLTLREGAGRDGETGEDLKSALPRKQFEEQGIHVIGIQEARTISSGLLVTENYFRVMGRSEGGHHGCELWLSRKLSMNTDRQESVYVERDKILVLFESPRILAVQVKPRGTSIIFFVLHAPHDGSEDSTKDDWWSEFRRLLGKYRDAGHIFCLGDFNARLGHSIDNCVGDRLCNCHSDNGRRLSETLQDYGLWIPSTYDSVHQGDDWTWTHPRGCQARLDYILCGHHVGLFVEESYVNRSIQSTLTVRDHEMVVVKLMISCEGAPHEGKGRRSYDWDLMGTSWGKDKVRELVANLPEPHWSEDVHMHWQLMEDALHEQLSIHFPAKPPKRRLDIFAKSTQQLLTKRKDFKKSLEHYDEMYKDEQCRWALVAWRDHTTLEMVKRRDRLHVYTMGMVRTFFLKGFRNVARELKLQIKQDKALFVENIVNKANGERGADIFAALKPLRIGGKARKMGIPPLPGFSEGGVQPVDPDTSHALWMKHCAHMEAGVFTTTKRLVQRARKGSFERAALMGDSNIHQIPSLTDLETAFRRVKRNKAGGVDDLKSDLCSIAAGELALKYHPLLQKMFFQAAEPVQMKGGVLIHAFKGGNARNVEDFRGLLLSSHIGKAIRRTFRQSIIPAYTSQAGDTHFSIRAGGNVSHASHALRLFISAATSQQQSVGILFLDIKSAYYRVVRQLLTSRGDNGATIDRLMEYLDLHDTDPEELRQAIANRAAEGEEFLHRQQELLLEEAMTSTWFTSTRRTELLESLAGSRPGDGLADVAFGLIFQRLMKIVLQKIGEELDIPEVDIQGPFDLAGPGYPGAQIPFLMDVVWADDLALAYRCGQAEKIGQAMQVITSHVFQQCVRHGLTPNLKKGKSEIMILPCGKGCRKARTELFNLMDPTLQIPNAAETLREVRLVPQYRHLGTRIHVGRRLMVEIKSRMGQAGTIYRKYRRQIFQNPRLGLRKRIFLFRSLIMLVFEYNLGTWGPLLKSEFRYFEKRLMAFYRGLARAEIGEEDLRLWNNDRVRAYVQLPSAMVILHGARLRYAISIYRTAPNTLWSLLSSERNWLCALEAAQVWFYEQLKGYGPDRHGHEWRPERHQWRMQDGASMSKWIRRAEQHDILQHTKQTEWEEWHFNTMCSFVHNGLQCEIPRPTTDDDQQHQEACLDCHRTFPGLAAWSVHAFKIHGVCNRARPLVGGSRCDSCAKEYTTTTRLQAHLCYNQECYRKLMRAGKFYPVLQPGKNSTREQRAPDLAVPPLSSEGPMEQALCIPAPEAEEIYDWDMLDAIFDSLRELPEEATMGDCREAILRGMSSAKCSFSQVKKTMTFAADTMEDEEASNVGWHVAHEKVRTAMQLLARGCELSLFFTPDELSKEPEDQAYRRSAWNHCSRSDTTSHWSDKSYVPRFGARTLAFLHLFSGERRSQDLQHFLERIVVPAGCLLCILSVDVIFNETTGDLTNPANQRKWLHYAWCGCIVGAFAGPPCESWSRARRLGGVAGYSVGDGGPRVI